MKKTLLFIAVAFFSAVSANAQTVWNFSNAPFGAAPTVSFASTFTTSDGLTVGTDGTVLWTGLTASAKTIDGVSYTIRLQTGGGGANVLPSYIPNTRYLAFNVSGASTIKIGMISSSSSATRTLIVVNDDQSLVDSVTNISGATAATYTYNYSGKAGKVYLYSRASGINYYYLSATNVVIAGVANVLADKGISFNGKEITNKNSLEIEVYNVLGKKVATSTTNIATANFQKGVYIVKAAGSTGAMKFSI
jgi:hypothetical protein